MSDGAEDELDGDDVRRRVIAFVGALILVFVVIVVAGRRLQAPEVSEELRVQVVEGPVCGGGAGVRTSAGGAMGRIPAGERGTWGGSGTFRRYRAPAGAAPPLGPAVGELVLDDGRSTVLYAATCLIDVS